MILLETNVGNLIRLKFFPTSQTSKFSLLQNTCFFKRASLSVKSLLNSKIIENDFKQDKANQNNEYKTNMFDNSFLSLHDSTYIIL